MENTEAAIFLLLKTKETLNKKLLNEAIQADSGDFFFIELSKFEEISSNTTSGRETYKLVLWPDNQMYIDHPDFQEKCYELNDENTSANGGHFVPSNIVDYIPDSMELFDNFN